MSRFTLRVARIELSAFLLILPLALACNQEDATTPNPPAQELVLRVGGRKIIPMGGVEVGFQKVTGDSRCPTTVQCVIAGAASMRLWLLQRGRDSVFVALALPGGSGFGPASAETLGYRMTAQALAPYPRVPGPIPESEYRLKLTVERARR